MLDNTFSFVCGGLAAVLILIGITSAIRIVMDFRKESGVWYVMYKDNRRSISMNYFDALNYLSIFNDAEYIVKMEEPFAGRKIWKSDLAPKEHGN